VCAAIRWNSIESERRYVYIHIRFLAFVILSSPVGTVALLFKVTLSQQLQVD